MEKPAAEAPEPWIEKAKPAKKPKTEYILIAALAFVLLLIIIGLLRKNKQQ